MLRKRDDVVRIQVEFSAERLKELNNLMEEADIPTKRELFNLAFTLLDWVAEERRRGRIIGSIDERSKTYKELVVPALNVIGKRECKENDEDPVITSKDPVHAISLS